MATKVRAKQIFGITSGPSYETIIHNLNPISAQPNSSIEIELTGEFFTPDMTIDISGNNTADNLVFINQHKAYITINSGTDQGSFDMILNNGKTKTHAGVLIISEGTPISLTANDWSTPAKVEDQTDGRQWLYANAWTENLLNVDLDGDFQMYFRRFPFGGATNTTFQVRVKKASDLSQLSSSGVNQVLGEQPALLRRIGSTIELFENGVKIYNIPGTSEIIRIAFVNYGKGMKDFRLLK
jgi:hypothetical protein